MGDLTRAMLLVEQSRSEADLARAAAFLAARLAGGRDELKRVFANWLGTLLRRQAAARFGAATADRLANALAVEADPERLAEIGEDIVGCTTGDELLRKIGVST